MADFEIQKDNRETCGCPFASMPSFVWENLFKAPFRKRHPVIFWGGWLLALALLGFICYGIFADDEGMPGNDSIAVIRIQGIIGNVEPVLAWIRKIEQTSAVKGVLVRVDSPGGGAAASQEIYEAIERLGKKVPVVASMGAMAASGGLMVSMGAQRIFANPSTVTGSIGVRMDIPQLQGLMNKIGIGQETLVTAPYKDAASYLHPLTPQDRAYLEGVIENMHAQFVGIIAKSRKMTIERVKELANGKIYTGEEAQKLGLVDELGGQEMALIWLCNKTGVPIDRKLITKPRSRSTVLETLLSGADTLMEMFGEARSEFSRPAFLYQ